MPADTLPAQLTLAEFETARQELPSGMLAALDHQEQLFVVHLLASPKMVQADAAVAAGFSKRRAKQTGHELMQRPHVRAAVDMLVSLRARRTAITADAVVRELGRIAFADIRRAMEWTGDAVQFVPSDQIDGDTAASIAAVEAKTRTVTEDGRTTTTIDLKMRQHNKLDALAILAKHTKVIGDVGPSEASADEKARAIREQLDAMDAAMGGDE